MEAGHLRGPYEVGSGNPARPYIMAVTAADSILGTPPGCIITAGKPSGGGPYWGSDTRADNARRIAACLNACDGMDTRLLERMATTLPQPFLSLLLATVEGVGPLSWEEALIGILEILRERGGSDERA